MVIAAPRRAVSWLVLTVLFAASFVAPTADALPRRARVQGYKRDLNFPVDAAWVRGTTKVFFTEKNTGKIRVLVGRRLLRRPCVDLAVDGSGERGALGIALHPSFKRNHKLYVYFTSASPLENGVTRFIVRNNRCTRPKRILDGLPAPNGYHNGGQLEFMGGHLFVSTGEAHDPALAQSRGSRLGKVLRLEPDGTIPRGNPFSGPGGRSPVWSYGHRNPFGLARRPGKRQLFETENGPECDDELNRISKGRNYGWGDGYACGTAGVGANPRPPLVRWSSVIVPTDPAFYRGRLQALSGALYVGDFSSGRLRRFNLGPSGNHVRSSRPVLSAGEGIVDVFKGPGGWLYFMTATSIQRIVRR